MSEEKHEEKGVLNDPNLIEDQKRMIFTISR
jgi:hypothetical protein